MHVCVVYDCLYPFTVGGAERWYRNLAERIAATGDDVTFLTLRQWESATPPAVAGVRVVAVGPRMELYTASGRRRLLPPLVFGAGVLGHLVRQGGHYDVVHTASFPYFSLLAAALVRRRGRYRLVVDWHEVWTDAYWRAYLGPVAGRVGALVQRACLRVRQRAFCFSRLHERRLHALGLRGQVTRLEGQYVGPPEPAHPEPVRPVVVYVGRLIPEKRPATLVAAVARARAAVPDLRCVIYGDGPERRAVQRAIDEHGLADAVAAPGFVDGGVLDEVRASALCLVLPSSREGYGLVVIEAAARGVPVVVVAGPDNAATELVEEGVNGVVAASAEPAELARAIVEIHRRGAALRESTAHWFRTNADRLSIEGSLAAVLDAYGS